MSTSARPATSQLNERPQRRPRKPAGARPTRTSACSTSAARAAYLARRLVERGCTVVGIELDPSMRQRAARTVCEDVLVGDVETMDPAVRAWRRSTSFSAATSIEHLRDPRALPRSRRGRSCAPGRTARPVDAERRELGDAARAFSRAAGGTRTAASSIARTRISSRARRSPRRSTGAGFDVDRRSSFTVPVPVVGTPRDRATSRTRSGALRPSLFAYQFVVAAEPA